MASLYRAFSLSFCNNADHVLRIIDLVEFRCDDIDYIHDMWIHCTIKDISPSAFTPLMVCAFIT